MDYRDPFSPSVGYMKSLIRENSEQLRNVSNFSGDTIFVQPDIAFLPYDNDGSYTDSIGKFIRAHVFPQSRV